MKFAIGKVCIILIQGRDNVPIKYIYISQTAGDIDKLDRQSSTCIKCEQTQVKITKSDSGKSLDKVYLEYYSIEYLNIKHTN